MPLLTISNLSKSYAAQTVFSDLSGAIHDGERVALVGVNGSGKTTLLRIIAGLEEPDGGAVSRARSVRLGYLPQDIVFDSDAALYNEMLSSFAEVLALQSQMREVETRLAGAGDEVGDILEEYGRLSQRFEEAGGYTYEAEINRVLNGLGFGKDDWEKPLAIMSGGQKTRAALARLLLSHPALLLLDEPTNYLDLAATEWLEDYLLHWPGAMLVVAHDRRFLDKIAQRVWELSYGQLEDYPGNYTDYTRLRAERHERRRAEYEAQQEQIAATEEFIRRYGAGQRSKEARGRAKRLARLERLERPQDEEAIRLRLKTTARGGDHVLVAENLAIGYGTGRGPGGNVLFSCPDLLIQRGERVALIGPNGSGKTTFLRTVLGEASPLRGRVRLGSHIHPAYYSQTHEGLNLRNSVLEEILTYDPVTERARSYLARFLFTGDDVYKLVGQLSGGERSRVALAKLTLENANFLLLDEPTNHLDILSQEVLEDVLGQFQGAVLFVSHDRYLIDALATHVWVVEGDRLDVYEGNYTDYVEEKAERARRAAAQDEQAAGRPAAGDRRQKRRLPASARPRTGKEERARQAQVTALEERIGSLEGKLAGLNTEMAQAGQQGQNQRVWELSLAYQSAEEELAQLLAQWEQAAE